MIAVEGGRRSYNRARSAIWRLTVSIQRFTATCISITLVWAVLFGFGVIDGPAATKETLAALSLAAPPNRAPRFMLLSGDTLGESWDQGMLLPDSAAAILLYRVSPSLGIQTKLTYLEALAARHAVSGLVVKPVTSSLDSYSPALRTLVDDHAEFTVLLNRYGVVRYAKNRALDPDQLRQLVERSLFGAAQTDFVSPVSDPAAWDRVLRTSELAQYRGANAHAFDMTYLFVLDASCPTCTIQKHVTSIHAFRRDSVNRRTGVILPARYLTEGPRTELESLLSAGPVFVSGGVLSPELRYITRDVPNAAPVVLRVEKGRVVAVSRLMPTVTN